MRILVTGGPTREPIDPVRFISNASTGKMGYAVAAAGIDSGHDVRLVSGPVHIGPPECVHVIDVVTTGEMADAVVSNVEWCDALVMAAAPADWRPVIVSGEKLKKDRMPSELPLESTRDILQSVKGSKAGRIFVGFAVETSALAENAARKLREKHLDLVVANDVASIASDVSKVLFVTNCGVREFPVMSKRDVAVEIIKWLESRQ